MSTSVHQVTSVTVVQHVITQMGLTLALVTAATQEMDKPVKVK